MNVSCEQPLVSADGDIIVAANGEMYNYKDLYSELKEPYKPKTGSDCEVILPLYKEQGAEIDFPRGLHGMFSFILYDKVKDLFFICRNHIGITPLYIGWANDGSVYVSSELKAIVGQCNKFQNFPPGHIFTNKGPNTNKFMRWYEPTWAPKMLPGRKPPAEPYQSDMLRTAFKKTAMRRPAGQRLMQ